MPCPEKIMMTAYVSQEDYSAIKSQAAQARLSISKYIRAACLGQTIKSKVDQEAVLALLKVNSDLGKLGGLLKLALSEKFVNRSQGNYLLKEIDKTRILLLEKVNCL